MANQNNTTEENYVMVLDVETTGFPTRRNAFPYYSKLYDNARIIEIAYILIDKAGNTIKEVSHLVQSGSKIENSHIHGITNEMVDADGISMEAVFDEMMVDLQKVDTLMAHNLDFDYSVILSEAYRKYANNRLLLSQLYGKQLYCTMIKGQYHMKQKKYPKLKELYEFLYEGETWEQTHRALDDVRTCVRCYQKMERKA